MTRALRPIRSLFLGPPGSGKGTQTGRIINDFPHISCVSSGDTLRKHVKHQTEIGKKVASVLERGELVSDDTMVSLIKQELKDNAFLRSDASWILDGFPRTAAQAPPLDTILKENSADLNVVVELKVPEEAILDRIEKRFVHIASGRVYNLDFNPPKVAGKDDQTGESLSKRPDDNAEVFKERLKAYRDLTTPLLEYYDKQGLLRSVEGETSDIIYPKLKQLLINEFGVN